MSTGKARCSADPITEPFMEIQANWSASPLHGPSAYPSPSSTSPTPQTQDSITEVVVVVAVVDTVVGVVAEVVVESVPPPPHAETIKIDKNAARFRSTITGQEFWRLASGVWRLSLASGVWRLSSSYVP